MVYHTNSDLYSLYTAITSQDILYQDCLQCQNAFQTIPDRHFVSSVISQWLYNNLVKKNTEMVAYLVETPAQALGGMCSLCWSAFSTQLCIWAWTFCKNTFHGHSLLSSQLDCKVIFLPLISEAYSVRDL